MAVSNRERVGRAFEQLAEGLGPYVDRRMQARSANGDRWFVEWARNERRESSLGDPAIQLKVMADCWDPSFRDELTRTDRNIVFELRDVRNKWAHNEAFTLDDAYRALDSIERLLASIDAAEAIEVGQAKADLMRARYEAVAKKGSPIQEMLLSVPAAGLKSWRAVIEPHDDVARGRFALAEFAADLHQVMNGRGSPEYADPVQFFRRTYLTQGLRTLLTEATYRLSEAGGVPVVDLQTNFGGGKTHSQIAAWHLFSGVALTDLPQELQDLVRGCGIDELPTVHRAALVGTRLSPGQPSIKEDGTEVRTLWGELAWQLGGAEGYAIVSEADRTGTNPGEFLGVLFERYSPCLVLIDEWVAYARQLMNSDELPGGSFDTHFSFAQGLTESARAVPGVLLVVSLPASESIEADHSGIGSDLAEVGGAAGREALQRLRNVVGRMESSWRPATAVESFEIVRRRLFKTFPESALTDRDVTARTFGEMYRRNASEFPSECREGNYDDKIKAAYPIHPELFARLYEDWSTLERFQRTRGVLRLMASVIHALWEGQDQSPLIMPASVPLADAAVAAELTRNLEDAWKPIIDTDVDGPSSLPLSLDRNVSNLGRHAAARRVARTVFLGSAATWRSPNRGIDAARIRLGCALPGESLAPFGDALNRLSGSATYFYADAGRYWYGAQRSVAQTARDRADLLLREALDDIEAELVRRLRDAQRMPGDFVGVHPAPPTSSDVPDEPGARLVILGPDRPHVARSEDSSALAAATELLERRGTTPREYRNTLVFLAPDNRKLEDLTQGVAEYLSWSSVYAERGEDGLNLDASQERLAESRVTESDRAVELRMAETYQWALVPTQLAPTAPISWDTVRVDGQDGLAQRVARKLVNDGLLYTVYAPTLLRQRLAHELASLWDPGHVLANSLTDAFARYLYLPRLRDGDVLLASISNGPASTNWKAETFATADGYDASADQYLGLVVGAGTNASPSTLLVRPDRAEAQLARVRSAEDQTGDLDGQDTEATEQPGDDLRDERLRRFHGSVRLNPERHAREFGRVSQEVIQNLIALLGTGLEITVDIVATNEEGFDQRLVRDVTENVQTLHFDDFGFEDR